MDEDSLVLYEYLAVPLDYPLPPVEISRMREFVQTFCDRCAFTGNKIRYVLYYAREPLDQDMNPAEWTQDPDVSREIAFQWDRRFHAEFPNLVTWFEGLPLDHIYGVDLVTQTADIPDHMDIFGFNNSYTYFRRFRGVEPVNYRVILCEGKDEASRTGSFYVSRRYGGDRYYVQIPETTRLFATSSSCCYHGATFNPGHYKTTVVIHATVDAQGHLDLLKASLKRYQDYAIRSRGAGPVDGPGAQLPYGGSD